MTEAEYTAFAELMLWAADMTAVPNGKDVERVTFSLFEELASYPLERVREAVRDHCRSEKFFPMLADIVTRIEGRAEDRAAAAWALVLRAIGRFGYYDSVRFPDPAIHYAISQMGGWRYLSEHLTAESAPFRAKDFARFFAIGERLAAWEHEPGKVRVAPYLVGYHEAENSRNGHDRRTVWDAVTCAPIPEGKLPALPAPGENVIPLIHSLTGRAKISQ